MVHALRFVARQPIFDRWEGVVGYELLFRDDISNVFRAIDGDVASRSVLDGSLTLGLDLLCDGPKGFVNCTRDALVKDYVTLLPRDRTVVEILPSVVADEPVLEACRRLRQGGYRLALDDFAPGDPRQPLISVVHLLKVDFRRLSETECHQLTQQYAPLGLSLAATKIETREEFDTALAMGYEYFQGYFFCRPAMLSTGEIPASTMHYLRLLKVSQKPLLDYKELEQLIKSDLSLCYRLLRYLHSSVTFADGITSIHHALALLGEQNIRKWISLVASIGAGEDRNREMVLLSLVRARFCELLSSRLRISSTDLFLTGLLSGIDGLLGLPLAEVLKQLPIACHVKEALLGKSANNRLRRVYELMLAYEAGDWASCSWIARRLNLTENQVAHIYYQSLQWAAEVSRS